MFIPAKFQTEAALKNYANFPSNPRLFKIKGLARAQRSSSHHVMGKMENQ